MTKAPTPTEKSKKQHDNKKQQPKNSITQRLRTDLGRKITFYIYTQFFIRLNLQNAPFTPFEV